MVGLPTYGFRTETYYLERFFSENCMKIKRSGSKGGRRGARDARHLPSVLISYTGADPGICKGIYTILISEQLLFVVVATSVSLKSRTCKISVLKVSTI